MWRLLRLCGCSLLIYLLVFSIMVDRPLSLGALRMELLQKTARIAMLPSPKLVILAGSNGPYSHSCVVLTDTLNMPCENAGIAVGIGLDDIFVRYEPSLHRGDIIYMPMELQQYTATASAYDASVDGEYLLRHDRGVLTKLPLQRILGAGLCCTLADLADALVEMPLARSGMIDPKKLLITQYDRQGDRIDNALSDRNPALLAAESRQAPAARAIGSGYGAKLVAKFVAHETSLGVIVIGGMPVDYSTVKIPGGTISAIERIYTKNGGTFTILSNRSHYPRADFFNSEDHLAKPCQYLNSIFVARRLGEILHKPIAPLPTAILHIAAGCPSEATD